MIQAIFALLAIVVGWGATDCPAQATFFPIDRAYFESNLQHSGWSLDDARVRGTVFMLHFKGDSIGHMFLDPAYGDAGDDCSYTYSTKGHYLLIRIGNCKEKLGRKPVIAAYLADERTLMVGIPKDVRIRNPDMIATEDWYRFKRYSDTLENE